MTTQNPTAPLGRIMLRNVRLAFPNIFEPKANDSGVLTFSAALILPPDHAQLAEIQAKMDEVGQAKWLDKWAATKRLLEKQDRLAVHDGDLKAKYDGYAGNLFINANAKDTQRPTVINQNRSPLTARDGVIYAGCYVNASLDFWAQKDHPKGGSRINAQLRGIQFLRDGDSFSAGRPADADEFDEIEGSGAGDFA